MAKAFLVFSGYNQRAVITLLRKLSAHCIPYFVVADGDRDTILQTTYRNKVCHIRRNLELSLTNMQELLAELQPTLAGHDVLFAPTTEALNRFFLEHREAMEAQGIQVPLVANELYTKISDKYPFSELCRQYDIPVPREFQRIDTCPLPFVAKQKHYIAGSNKKPLLVLDEAGRQNFLAAEDSRDFYLQEFITGRSHYLLAHLSRSGQTLTFSQENLIQQPDGKSIIAARAGDYHQTADAARYIDMLASYGFFGLVMIEVRQKGDTFYMIEANPRLWGPSQLYVDAMQEDLLDAFLRDLGFSLRTVNKPYLSPRYFWYEGYAETLHQGQQPTYHNYSPDQLAVELPLWMENEMYGRPDTQTLFLHSLLKTS